jgi:Domain of unknown function (DUF2089)-HTH
MLNNSDSAGGSLGGHVLGGLPREDLDLIAELVFQSGSLKGLAKVYGVSYPTIRGRVDKVIGRLRDVVEGREPDPLRELLATLVERGELTTSGARRIHEAARERAESGVPARSESMPDSKPRVEEKGDRP